MKTANISELKARLSSYLAAVRGGETVIVYDRNTPIARVIPYEQRVDVFDVDGRRRPVSELKKVRGVRSGRPVDVVELLREDRDQR